MIEIKPANLRDASWLMANLRQLDREETFCQLPDGTPTDKLAEWFITPGDAFIAYYRDEPALLFGTTPISVCAMSIWALGTDRAERTIPAVSRFLIEHAIPWRLDQGFTCMEARSLETHHDAHRWMEGMGGERNGEPYLYGKGGERFVTYRWTVSSYRAISRSRWSGAVPQEFASNVHTEDGGADRRSRSAGADAG